ncbi:U6 snRNA-associated Sm-like protein LSm6 [Clarias magur]|uniref:U6 snRNA-associated Sm-like protein LSm6 n=1 Tax=Clarias magur TaxID=1594786 RepID=A0A8J4U7U9_CLAMG|nr:U6 snRNA-associated Sm-like protein LSm6 [Clarias magur]
MASFLPSFSPLRSYPQHRVGSGVTDNHGEMADPGEKALGRKGLWELRKYHLTSPASWLPSSKVKNEMQYTKEVNMMNRRRWADQRRGRRRADGLVQENDPWGGTWVKMSIRKQTPSDFLKQIIGRPVVVKLNSGVDYRGVLACLDGYMNIAVEQTEEYVNGQLKNKYGDAFLRGNNVLYISTQKRKM